jgi:regulatory protein
LLRYPASSANVARFLQRAVPRIDPDATAEDAEPLIRDVLEGLRADGLLNDAAFASARARRLLQRGQPPRRIAADLQARQVPESALTAALETLAAESGDPEEQEFRAACRTVQRRRLGPYHPPAEREAMRARDLAILGRAGFSYAVARRAVLLEDVAEVEAVIRFESK